MVNIDLPIHIGADLFNSSVEVLGAKLTYTETPVHLSTTLKDHLQSFREAIQFKEGNPQDTVDVSIRDRNLLIQILIRILKNNAFATDMSVEQPFIDHLSEALAVELSKSLGLNAIGSLVQIPAATEFFEGMAILIVESMESSATLRQFLYEQYLSSSPERFPPGTNAEYAPIPFSAGDTISFFLTVKFDNATINGSDDRRLADFLSAEEMPVVRFVVRFSFA